MKGILGLATLVLLAWCAPAPSPSPAPSEASSPATAEPMTVSARPSPSVTASIELSPSPTLAIPPVAPDELARVWYINATLETKQAGKPSAGATYRLEGMCVGSGEVSVELLVNGVKLDRGITRVNCGEKQIGFQFDEFTGWKPTDEVSIRVPAVDSSRAFYLRLVPVTSVQ